MQRTIQHYTDQQHWEHFAATECGQRLKMYQNFDDRSQLPIILMPDLAPDHALPVGAALQLVDHLLPFAFGTDPGCGYGCWIIHKLRSHLSQHHLQQWVKQTSLSTAQEIHNLNSFVFNKTQLTDTSLLAQCLPSKPQNQDIDWLPTAYQALNQRVLELIYHHSQAQLGMLAPGNHYIELHTLEHSLPGLANANTDLLLVVHNGSLGLGQTVQRYGLRLAAGRQAITQANLPSLALHIEHPSAHLYWHWLQYAYNFATFNRAVLAARSLQFWQQQAVDCSITPVSDEIHSGICQQIINQQSVWTHLSGTQILKTLNFIGGGVGDNGALVKPGDQLSLTHGIICHGTTSMDYPLSTTNPAVVSNLAPDQLAVKTFAPLTTSIEYLSNAHLIETVTKTSPIAIIKCR